MKTFPLLLGALLLSLSPGLAQKKLGEAATLEGIEIKGNATPGGRVTAVIKFKLEPGYHVHSHQPSQPEFIPTVLTVGDARGIKVGTVSYPAGKTHPVPELPKPLSVYEEHFEVTVPIGLTAAAQLPVTLPAKLQYQACKGAVCYRPFDLKFDVVLGEKKSAAK